MSERKLSKKAQAAIFSMVLLEAVAIALIFLAFCPYSKPDGKVVFGSITAPPEGLTVNDTALVLEIIAAMLPISTASMLLVILESKKNRSRP